MSGIPEFKSLDSTFIKHKGWMLYMAYLDRETEDFSHLIGKDVSIDGKIMKCHAVERYLHNGPWRKGELIGLAVDA